jgi:hypothetical protein
MKESINKLGVVGYIFLSAAVVALMTVACSASAVWGG